VIDDERFDRSFARFESEAELFLESSEYRGRGCRIGSGPGPLSRKLDANIESSGPGRYAAADDPLTIFFTAWLERRTWECGIGRATSFCERV
jgi:hypothetical protein